MAVVELFMWRHRITTEEAESAFGIRFRWVCSCGWRSLPYKADATGRASAALAGKLHIGARGGPMHILWEIV